MLKLLFSLPKQLTIALSGGVDSIAVTDFLSKNHSLDCAFFHHGTDASEKAYQFVSVFCHERNLPLTVAF